MCSLGFQYIVVSVVFTLGLFSIAKAQTSCTVVKDESYYLNLSVDDFFEAVSNGNRIGTCLNALNTGSGFCYYYARCQYPGRSDIHGCPLNNNGQGTGCVKAPDEPKGVRVCFYKHGYDFLTESEVNSFCTETGKENLVAQLKWALRKGYCNLPPCVKPVACRNGTPGCKCICGGSVLPNLGILLGLTRMEK